MKNLLLAIVLCTVANPKQSKIINNGLKARIDFEINTKFNTQIIHPKLHLTNTSKKTQHFFWWVYDAGDFKIKDSLKNPVTQKFSFSRSGPVAPEIISIKPGKTIIVDAYDYGYGIKQQPNTYVFNTHTTQRVLKPGSYFVDYYLNYTPEKLHKIIPQYCLTKNNITVKDLWTGTLELNNKALKLPK